MAAYNCTLFLNTGFNTINIPDSPALVNGMSSISVPALDINQERFLPSVRVRATWAQVKDADYCKVGDFYYTIQSITMTSQDVAEISLIPDYITSAGGPAALEILDGLTSRVHVSDDSFGLYGGNDPYMNPAYDMDVISGVYKFGGTVETFVESTLNLESLGSAWTAGQLEAFTAKDKYAEDQGATEVPEVTVPVANYLKKSTSYVCTMDGQTINLQNVQNQGIFRVRDGTFGELVSDGINVARSLGIEQSISGQFCIPTALVDVTAGTTPNFVATLSGKHGTIVATDWIGDTPSYIYGSANNNRVWYGGQSKYTLVSATGESISANAEECYNPGQTVPFVKYWADPRRTGKPYFRFGRLNGNAGSQDLFRGCVSGRQWNSVPMVLTEKSGSVLDRMNYNASVAQRDLTDVYQETGYNWNRGVNMFGIGASTLTAGMSGFVEGGGFSKYNMAGASGVNVGAGGKAGASTLSQGLAGIGNFELGNMAYKDTSALQRQIEKDQFQIQQNINVPTVMFPNDPSLMAEYLHNGCMLSRVVYKAQDIARIDKILTAFGYKYVKVLEASDFSNRQKFNYVEGSITVGNLPKWWAEGIGAQITGGVRVWHIKPTHTAYSSNPIA